MKNLRGNDGAWILTPSLTSAALTHFAPNGATQGKSGRDYTFRIWLTKGG